MSMNSFKNYSGKEKQRVHPLSKITSGLVDEQFLKAMNELASW